MLSLSTAHNWCKLHVKAIMVLWVLFLYKARSCFQHSNEVPGHPRFIISVVDIFEVNRCFA